MSFIYTGDFKSVSERIKGLERKFLFDDFFERGHFYRIISPYTFSMSLKVLSSKNNVIELFHYEKNRLKILFFSGYNTVSLEESDVFRTINVFSKLIFVLDSIVNFYSYSNNTFDNIENDVETFSFSVLESYDLSLRVLELYLSMPFSDFEKRTFLDSVTLSVRMNPFLDFSLYGSIDESLRVPFNSEDYRGYLDVYIGNLKLYYDIIKDSF